MRSVQSCGSITSAMGGLKPLSACSRMRRYTACAMSHTRDPISRLGARNLAWISRGSRVDLAWISHGSRAISRGRCELTHLRVLGREGRVSGEQHVGDAAKRPEVDLIRVSRAAEELRREKVGRAHRSRPHLKRLDTSSRRLAVLVTTLHTPSRPAVSHSEHLCMNVSHTEQSVAQQRSSAGQRSRSAPPFKRLSHTDRVVRAGWLALISG